MPAAYRDALGALIAQFRHLVRRHRGASIVHSATARKNANSMR